MCTEPERHRDRYAAPATAASRSGDDTADEAGQSTAGNFADRHRAEQASHRRQVIANNKTWRQAQPIRREWVTALMARKTAPKGTAAFLAVTLAEGIDGPASGPDVEYVTPAALLTLSEDVSVADYATAQSDARAVVVAAAVAVSRYENALSVESWRADSWRGRSRSAARYFAWLAANGYPLCTVERLAAGLPAEDSAATDTTDTQSSEVE